YRPWTPQTQPRLNADLHTVDMFAEIRRGDILVHHPYDAFGTSVERFIEQAVDDPDVLAIKHTIYRTSGDSPIVPALVRAVEQGQQAVAMVRCRRGSTRSATSAGRDRWSAPASTSCTASPG